MPGLQSSTAEAWACPPTAHVEQIGRFTYRVWVAQGISIWGPNGYGWNVWGRARAERKARRVLARYIAKEKTAAIRAQRRLTITADAAPVAAPDLIAALEGVADANGWVCEPPTIRSDADGLRLDVTVTPRAKAS